MAETPAIGFAWIDGAVVPLSQARVSVLDRGYLLGDGVFETMRASGGRLFQEHRHAARLERGASTLGLPRAAAREAIRAASHLARASTERLGAETLVRTPVTVGPSTEVGGDLDAGTATAIARPHQPYPAETYLQGLRLRVGDPPIDSRHPLCAVKTLSFLPRLHARRQAIRVGGHDALLLNERGRIAEATTSNVFALVGDVLHTPGPAEGALEGVTRALLLDAARAQGYAVEETLTMEQFLTATEAFATNTVAGVVPITRVLGPGTDWSGRRGPATDRSREVYADAYAAFSRVGLGPRAAPNPNVP